MAKKRTETRVNYTLTYPAGSGLGDKDDNGNKTDVAVLFNEVENSKGLLKKLEEAKGKGAQVELTRGVTFTLVEAEKIDDILELVTGPDGKANEEEGVNIFNRGAVLKQQVEMRSVMNPDDTTDETLEKEGWAEKGYDLSTILPIKSERREADPFAKSARALKAAGIEIDAATLATLLKQFQAQPAGQAA